MNSEIDTRKISSENSQSMTRRGLLHAAAVAGAVAVANADARAERPGLPNGATPGPETRPSIGPDGQPLAPEYVDGLPPGMRGEGQLVKGYAAPLIKTKLQPITIKRREPGEDDVELDILYCGICHSDFHMVHNDWKNAIYPVMPGHEFVGKVTRVGGAVTRFKAGDLVAVGPVVDSCGQCKPCQEKIEQYCEGPKGRTEAYNGPAKQDGTTTYGGYSKRFVVKEKFAYHVPPNLDLKAVAPLLCAGMTVYSPLVHWKAGPGVRVGVVGMGGLGHMAVKFAAAMGAEVTVFSTTPEKQADAMRFGAKHFVLSKDEAAMMKMEKSQDQLLNTIPYPYDPKKVREDARARGEDDRRRLDHAVRDAAGHDGIGDAPPRDRRQPDRRYERVRPLSRLLRQEQHYLHSRSDSRRGRERRVPESHVGPSSISLRDRYSPVTARRVEPEWSFRNERCAGLSSKMRIP